MKRFSRGTIGGACPRCGGTSFRARRSGLGVLALGFLARKSRVECETCGKRFRRG